MEESYAQSFHNRIGSLPINYKVKETAHDTLSNEEIHVVPSLKRESKTQLQKQKQKDNKSSLQITLYKAKSTSH